MKKFVAFALALALTFALIGSACADSRKIDLDNLYPRTARVYEIDRDADLVTVIDAAGFLWEFYGVEDWEVDDLVSLLMFDNGTKTIFDDEIIKAYYGGVL